MARRRTYWVEEDGQWGLLAAMEDGDEVSRDPLGWDLNFLY